MAVQNVNYIGHLPVNVSPDFGDTEINSERYKSKYNHYYHQQHN